MTEHFLQLGERNIYGGDHAFGLEAADRRYHLYVIGKTGTGKTTLLRNLILQDIEAGHGLALIDPHGDLADELLEYIPRCRTNDVAYFNPMDYDFPIGLNLLQRVPPQQRHRVASGLVSIFKSIWRDSWGPRLEYILYATVAALLEVEQGATLLGVPRMLTDDAYRDWVVRQVHDPIIRSFWIDEFARYEPRFMREAIAPIQNKVGQLLMASPIRNILGQVRPGIELASMINENPIFIANLSKGLLGEDKSNLLGAALVNQFQLAAMGRTPIPENERKDFFLYIDEFHNFSTDSFVSILSEARKYRLNLTVAHQYTSQVDPKVQDAVFGNVGTMVSFRIGHKDAASLSQEYGEEHVPRQFTGLNNHDVLVRPLAHGNQASSFLGKTLPSLKPRRSRRAQIILESRQRYSTPREVVEDKIRRWMKQ